MSVRTAAIVLHFKAGVNVRLVPINVCVHRPVSNDSQVHLHWHLHFRVGNKDFRERVLFSAVHLPERPVELARLHRHHHGVSSLFQSNLFDLAKLPETSQLFCLFCLKTATQNHC